ncbi:MAG: 3'-5' exonuclease [Oscillospiraceae bacterium]
MSFDNISEKYLELRREIIKKRFGRMNDMQLEAVVKADGPVLILAGAGSGKTTVLVNRVANLVEFGDAYESQSVPSFIKEDDVLYMQSYLEKGGDDARIKELISANAVKPWNILAITFTNKAAAELRDRLSSMLGETASDINAATFHSACLRILRVDGASLGYSSSFTIYDTDDSVRVIKEVLKSFNLDDKMYPPKQVLGQMGRFKDELLTPDEAIEQNASDFKLAQIAKIYKEYQSMLKKANALDFDDIITQTVRLLSENPEILEKYRNRYRYIMVDEYQDTNHAQYMLVSLLAGKHQNLCVVGDDDQSIYKFRGATIENIMSFEKEFPTSKVIRLEQNYRCTQNILDAANNVIKNNSSRKGKTLWTDNGTGTLVNVLRARDEFAEANYIADKISDNVRDGDKFADHAILYRMNAQSNSIEKILLRSGIPYRIFGGVKFYERKEIKDVIAYLSIINNPADSLRLKRIINEPKRGIGVATLTICEDIAQSLGISLFEVLDTSDEYAPLARKLKPLKEFADMLKEIMAETDSMTLSDFLDFVLEKTGYLLSLKGEGMEGLTRIENVQELKSNMVAYEKETENPTLSGFLEDIALYTDLDRYDTDNDAVIMMTLHSAKGLEFPNVFITGLEDNIFPSMLAMHNPGEIEEERRLAYVGITRAKKRLYLTCSAQRMLFGKTNYNRISTFIKEIPKDLCDLTDQTIRVVNDNVPSIVINPFPDTRKTIGVGATAQTSADIFVVGERVYHKIFGEGVINSVTPMGNDNLLEINFDRKGPKKIMSNFAKLTRVE